MRDKVRAIARMLPDLVAAALYFEAELLMTESKKRVPVLTGTLRASGHVQEPEISGKMISVAMVYGGAAEAYALRVHEDLEMHHPRGGQAKYLSSVLDENADSILARIAGRIDLGLGAI